LNACFQRVYGVQVYYVTRRTDLYYINLPGYMMDRWTGEGSSDRIPRYSFESANENWRASDLWVEDGSYLRLKNVQIGYTLPKHLTRKIFISNLRIYLSGETFLTFTNYTGFDPKSHRAALSWYRPRCISAIQSLYGGYKSYFLIIKTEIT
jgi:hypothetical protein